MPILRACLLLTCLSLLPGCNRPATTGPAEQPGQIRTQTVASPEEGGAVSRAPVVTSLPAAPATTAPPPVPRAADWSPIQLASGQAWIDCGLDYRRGDGEPLSSPTRANLRHLIEPCRPGDVLRLRYRGKIANDFTALVERVTRVADSLGVESRVLDLDSTGGQVEDAVRAGDWIGANHWTIWVREDSVCHSACVFVLAGGDSRRLAGRVGIHRIIRLSSTATSRTELNTELQAVYSTVREYLERNGASPLLADVMKTVPNRSLRLLTPDELALYGLDGNNAAQDDLDRVRLLDKCGDDFMRRRDAWCARLRRALPHAGRGVRAQCVRPAVAPRFRFSRRRLPGREPAGRIQRAARSAPGRGAATGGRRGIDRRRRAGGGRGRGACGGRRRRLNRRLHRGLARGRLNGWPMPIQPLRDKPGPSGAQ